MWRFLLFVNVIQVVVGSNPGAADQLIPRESAGNTGRRQADFFVLIPRYPESGVGQQLRLVRIASLLDS